MIKYNATFWVGNKKVSYREFMNEFYKRLRNNKEKL